MAALVWDKTGERFYETGVSKGVLYVADKAAPGGFAPGVAWNGLTSVTESPTGAEPTALYADNIKYLNLMSIEEFEATIEAYTYPDEFAACDGSAEIAQGALIGQQKRVEFAMCYQTKVGNDQDPDLGYKLHIIYGALASPSERAYETVNDSPDAIAFSWDITTTPVEVTGYKPTALVTIDSTKADAAKLQTVLDALYGTNGTGDPDSGTEPRLVMPNELVTMLAADVSG